MTLASRVLAEHDFVCELDERLCLADGCAQIGTADVEESIVGLVLEREEPAKRLSRAFAAGLHLLNQGDCFAVVLAARATTKRLAAGCVGRGDAREDSDSGRGAAVLHVVAFAGGELRDIEKLARVLEARFGVARRMAVCLWLCATLGGAQYRAEISAVDGQRVALDLFDDGSVFAA